MVRVKANGDDLITAANKSKSLDTELSDALKQSKSLLKKVQGMKWKGNARDSFISYLDIISQYHDDINENAKKQHKAFSKLNSKIDDYGSDETVVEVKRI